MGRDVLVISVPYMNLKIQEIIVLTTFHIFFQVTVIR